MLVKRLILLLGPNGVGKSTAAHALMRLMPGSAYVETDALRAFNADFACGGYELQLANLRAVIGNYLSSDLISAVILPYGLHGHRRALLSELVDGLRAGQALEVTTIAMNCAREENIRRMRADGRDEGRIERTLRSRALYEALSCPRLDVTGLSVDETAHALLGMLESHDGEAREGAERQGDV